MKGGNIIRRNKNSLFALLAVVSVISSFGIFSPKSIANIEKANNEDSIIAFPTIISPKIQDPESKSTLSLSTNILPVNFTNINTSEQKTLIPGGEPFGVKFFTKGVLVVGLSDITSGGKKQNPAFSAGIRVRDIITKINGKEVNTIEQVSDILNSGNTGKLNFEVQRNNSSFYVDILPIKSDDDGLYKIGTWIRDSTAGIGTITFIDPKTGLFGGLGHGIYDIDTGTLLPLSQADVFSAQITGQIMGKAGSPGELKGIFIENEKISNLKNNTDCGVFGIMINPPTEGAIPIATKNEVKTGKAQIKSTINGTEPEYYDIEITAVYKTSGICSKNMLIKITDPKLLSTTGGIVQGMSGSPIIQDGKLVGAVTHVLVSDPTKGYGIFIENMLSKSSF